MANGTFLVSLLIGDRPSLVKFTCKHGDPVVQVDLYKPSAGDLIPIDRDRFKPDIYESPLRRHLKDTGVISEGSVDSIGYISQSIHEQIEKLGQEAWAEVLAKNGEPRPADWDEVVKDGVTKFLGGPDTARRLVERVTEDAVVVKINPLNYPEPLRQHILSTPHLARGVDDDQS